jgi:hypothetical protein
MTKRFSSLNPLVDVADLCYDEPGIHIEFKRGQEGKVQLASQITSRSLKTGDSVLMFPFAPVGTTSAVGQTDFEKARLMVGRGTGDSIDGFYHNAISGSTTTRPEEWNGMTRLRLPTNDGTGNWVEAFVGSSPGWKRLGPDGHMPCLTGVVNSVDTFTPQEMAEKNYLMRKMMELPRQSRSSSTESEMDGFYSKMDTNVMFEYPQSRSALPELAMDTMTEDVCERWRTLMPSIAEVTTGLQPPHITIYFVDEAPDVSVDLALGPESLKRDDKIILLPQTDFYADVRLGLMKKIGPSALIMDRDPWVNDPDTKDPIVSKTYLKVEGHATKFGRAGTREAPTSLILSSKGGTHLIGVIAEPGATFGEFGRNGYMSHFGAVVDGTEVCPVSWLGGTRGSA